MSKKQNTAGDPATNRATRPAMYAFGAAVVICVIGVILANAAPAVFVAIGGWVTVIVIFFLIAVWAGLAIVRNTNKNAGRMDDEPGA